MSRRLQQVFLCIPLFEPGVISQQNQKSGHSESKVQAKRWWAGRMWCGLGNNPDAVKIQTRVFVLPLIQSVTVNSSSREYSHTHATHHRYTHSTWKTVTWQMSQDSWQVSNWHHRLSACQPPRAAQLSRACIKPHAWSIHCTQWQS